MVELKILDYLSAALSVPVYMERPIEIPEKYVIVEKVGSTTTNYIYKATIAVQSYAPTLYMAAQLNEEVKAAVLGLLSHDDISSVVLNTDYNFTDTATKTYRYQALFNIVAYDD